MLTWEQVKGEFKWDGSFRDLYVMNTSIRDWDRLLAAIRSSPYPSTFFIDNVPATLPSQAREGFLAFQNASVVLSVEVRRVMFNFFFFKEEQIEFNLDPRDFKGQADLDALLEFMRFVGQAVGKEIIMTPEGFYEEGIYIFTYIPESDEIRYTAFGGWI